MVNCQDNRKICRRSILLAPQRQHIVGGSVIEPALGIVATPLGDPNQRRSRIGALDYFEIVVRQKIVGGQISSHPYSHIVVVIGFASGDMRGAGRCPDLSCRLVLRAHGGDRRRGDHGSQSGDIFHCANS